MDYEERHNRIALPCVRIRAGKAGGSGTILYSRPTAEDGDYSSYVLTNHHVVDGCIKVEKKWSTLLKAERKMDVFETVDVHLFEYRWASRAIGGMSVQADIACYDKDEDLALVHLRTGREAPAVAELYPRYAENHLRVGMPVLCVGAGLGEAPVQTGGFLSQFGREIERKEFWLHTAPSIYGNSGGALFLADTYQFIGVPARIAVMLTGFSSDAITHLSFAIPVTRIYQFLEDQRYRFIYSDEFTEQGEEEERERLREEQERKLAATSE